MVSQRQNDLPHCKTYNMMEPASFIVCSVLIQVQLPPTLWRGYSKVVPGTSFRSRLLSMMAACNCKRLNQSAMVSNEILWFSKLTRQSRNRSGSFRGYASLQQPHAGESGYHLPPSDPTLPACHLYVFETRVVHIARVQLCRDQD